MQPTVLPGRAAQRVDRVSRLLFHWRAADLSIRSPIAGVFSSFTRATAGGYISDVRGCLRNVAQAQPRFEMVDLDGDGTRETPGLLIEGQRLNLITRSESFSAWTAIGTPSVVGNQRDPAGGVAAYLLGDDDAGSAEAVYLIPTYTGDGTKAISIYLKQGSAATTDLTIWDQTASATIVGLRITWGATPLAAVISGGGTAFTPVAHANGWWRFAVAANDIVAGHANWCVIWPASQVAADTGTVYAFGAQAENAVFPSSYVKADAGSAVARDADVVNCSANFGPLTLRNDDLTFYARFKRAPCAQITEAGAYRGICALSSSVPQLMLYWASSGSLAVARISSGSIVATAAMAVADPQEFCAQFQDLAAAGRCRIDGGAGFGADATGGTPFAAFGDSTLQVGYWSGSWLWAGLLSLKIARGLFTLSQMREMF